MSSIYMPVAVEIGVVPTFFLSSVWRFSTH